MRRPLFVPPHVRQQTQAWSEACERISWPKNRMLAFLKVLAFPVAFFGLLRRRLTTSPTRIEIERQLMARVSRDPGVPEATHAPEELGEHGELFRQVSALIKEELGWPNACFLPEDPLRLLMVTGIDELDDVNCTYRIEDELGIRFSDDDLSLCREMSLGAFVAFLARKQAVQCGDEG